MRNVLQYPVTLEEIQKCLLDLSDEIMGEGVDVPVGDMRPFLLQKAAEIVMKSDEKDLNF